MARRNDEDYFRRQRRGRELLRRRQVRPQRGGKIPRWAWPILVLGGLGFIGLLAAGITGIVVYRSYADQLVAPDELAINQPSYGAKILDRNGKVLYEYVDDKSGLRRPVTLDTVAPQFLAATIATEDDTFFTNPGINAKGLARAAWENLSPLSGTPGLFSGSGGSSITQQLVKSVYIPEQDRQKRSASRKIKEIVYALELTSSYDKERILDWYVNQISYGGVYNGVEAASEGYFGKPAKDLTLAEGAMLAGLPQSPAAYDPVNHPDAAMQRRNEVLDIMLRQGRVQIGDHAFFTVDPDAIAAAKLEPITIAAKRFPVQAPHFVLEYVQPQLEQLFGHDALFRDGLVVQTSLDIDLQNQTQDVMEKWISQNEAATNDHNGSMMIMDPKTGEILTMIGSRDYFNDSIEGKNNNATACYSPGSSFKPFAYLTSFLQLGWGPGTMILDAPISFKQNDGSYFQPVNPDKLYHGPITIRNALGNSYNVPAVKMAAAVGPDKIVQEARSLGFLNTFRTIDSGGCSPGGFGPAIATGGIDVTLEDMMFGYTVLANGGIMRGAAPFSAHNAGERGVDPVSILKVTDAKGQVIYDSEKNRKETRVAPADYTYLITDILTDPNAQCADFGCGGLAVPGYKVAVKTGASQPFDPNGPNADKTGATWTFGYTPDVVIGIWAGNTDKAPLSNLLSTTIAFKAVRDAVVNYYNGGPETPFIKPDTVVTATECVPSGLRPTPACGKTTTDIWAKDELPTKDDTWWQGLSIDLRTGYLAAPGTNPLLTQQQTTLVVPPGGDQQWAKALGAAAPATAPTDASGNPLPNAAPPVEAPAAIYVPVAGGNVNGVVQVVGRAASPAFQFYRLEFGAGSSPGTWTLIGQGFVQVPGGTLGNWLTTGLPAGVYTLRLVVIDAQRGQIIGTVSVSVGQVPPPPSAGGGPN